MVQMILQLNFLRPLRINVIQFCQHVPHTSNNLIKISPIVLNHNCSLIDTELEIVS